MPTRSPRAFLSSAASFAADGRFAGSSASARSTTARSGAGRSGRSAVERRRALRDRVRGLRERGTPERVPTCERLVEEHADRPDVARRIRRLAVQPLRRDVGERSRNVARRGERFRVGKSSEPEVEQPHRDLVAVGTEQDVRRLHVAVDDAVRVRVRQPVEHLGRSLDRDAVGHRACAQRLAERASRNVLVGDVDVLVVAPAGIHAEAALVVEARHRLRLAARARAGLALARDDLHGDIASRSARRARARPSPTRRCRVRGSPGSAPGRDGSLYDEQPLPTPSAILMPPSVKLLSSPTHWLQSALPVVVPN